MKPAPVKPTISFDVLNRIDVHFGYNHSDNILVTETQNVKLFLVGPLVRV